MKVFAVKLCEIATQVRVIDRERPYYYWVSVANPARAIATALKKHRGQMGMMPGEGELEAAVVAKPAEV